MWNSVKDPRLTACLWCEEAPVIVKDRAGLIDWGRDESYEYVTVRCRTCKAHGWRVEAQRTRYGNTYGVADHIGEAVRQWNAHEVYLESLDVTLPSHHHVISRTPGPKDPSDDPVACRKGEMEIFVPSQRGIAEAMLDRVACLIEPKAVTEFVNKTVHEINGIAPARFKLHEGFVTHHVRLKNVRRVKESSWKSNGWVFAFADVSDNLYRLTSGGSSRADGKWLKEMPAWRQKRREIASARVLAELKKDFPE